MTAAYLGGAPQPDAKRFATAQARCALAGVQLIASQDDRGHATYILSRWALTVELQTLDDVEHWLDRLEGRAG